MASIRLDYPSLLFNGSVNNYVLLFSHFYDVTVVHGPCSMVEQYVTDTVPGVPARFPPMAVKLNGEMAATNPSLAL